MSFIQQFFTSRDNNANAATFVGQEGRLWWDPITNQIYSSDGNTPGGIPLSGGGGNGSPGGANSQVQFNQNGNFGGSANLTFDKTTGALTAISFAGNGSALSNITGANVTGVVNESTYASSAVTAITAETVTANSQPNITSLGTLVDLSVTGNVTGDYFIGNGSQLTGINSGASNTIFNGNSNVAIDAPDSNVTITANASQPYTWTFDTSGELSLAGNIVASSNTAIKTNNDSAWISQAAGQGGFSQLYWTSDITNADPYDGNGDFAWAYVDAGGFFVTSRTVEPARSYNWDFRGSDGTLITPGKFITPVGDTSARFDFRVTGDGSGSDLEFGANGPGSQYFFASVQDPVGRSADFQLNAVDEGDINARIRTADGLGTTMQWDFNANGDLILPGDTAYIGSDASRVSIYSDINTETAGITVTSGSSTNIFNEGVVNIETNSGDVLRQWQFDQTGDLTIPGSIILPVSGSITTSGYNNPESLMANADSNWAYGFSSDDGANYYTQVKFFGDHSTTRGFKILDSDSGNVWLFNGDGGLTAPGIIETTGSISATGNISTSGYFIGNGSQLTGLDAVSVGNANYANTAGSTTQLVNGSSTVALYSDGTMSFPNGLINTSSNTIGLWSTNTTSLYWRTPTATTAGQPFQSIFQLSNSGITITALSGNVSNLTTKNWGFGYNGNLIFPDSTIQTTAFTGTAATVTTNAQPNITSVGTMTSVTSSGNVSGSNLLASGAVYITSSAASAGEIKFLGATELANIVAVGAIANTLTGNGSINMVTGSAQGGNIGFYVAQSERGRFTSSGLGVTGNTSVSGNIASGNLIITGQVIAGNGSITQPGFRFAGDTDSGLYLTGDGNIAVVTNAGIRVLINDSGANITGSINLTSALSATGNITAGNINTAGQVVATGNITGARVVATGNVTGGNIITAGQISATGTITSNGGTDSTAFAVGNSAVSNVALGMFPTAGTPGEYAIRDHSTVTTNMYFDVGVGGTANGQFTFRTTNSYSTLATVNIYGITLTTNRPAFRVIGSGTTNNLTTTQNGTGALNGNNWAADYTQGSGLNSTTGVFTAPVAGLYQINVVGRNSGYAGGISQLAVVKNATGGTGAGGTVACMIEWAASSSMNHVGSGTVARLAVNDTLALKVLAGQINFDSNDNWSIAYLG